MKLDDLGKLMRDVDAIRAKADKAGAEAAEQRTRAEKAEAELGIARARITRLESELAKRGPVGEVDEEFLRRKSATAKFVGYPQKPHVELMRAGSGESVRAPSLTDAVELARARWSPAAAIARPPSPARVPAPPPDDDEVEELED